ncbi:MAG: hypothetical protein WD824_01255 [Cyclobacteriaceae bacterium]
MRSKKILYPLFLIAFAFSCESDLTSANYAGGAGQGGSMTRFSIVGTYMYVVNNSTIQVFDISQQAFTAIHSESVGFGMETVFASGEYLYLGASDAMYIYSIADREHPEFIFRYSHIRSCDPVVVQGNRAYVTLRSGNRCNAGTNALEILDITNPYSPFLVKNYPMNTPHGLAIEDNLLFICEGNSGLKLFDVSNEQELKLLHTISDIDAYDVIVRNGIATVTGEDGVFQYQFNTSGSELILLSTIPVSRVEI